ncbi:hypothetical protein NECAME_05944 [Necator americanus]|uniref:Uncharacterized protein n=1 Tax=Necator americanus TaxID=51031 RepID=W2TWT0_NECAM|nr:hypothetical protein NECAME_05944 [Necator americanus]ETN86540.1 hypothetical protein NECAME_05944 [Necator americanus]
MIRYLAKGICIEALAGTLWRQVLYALLIDVSCVMVAANGGGCGESSRDSDTSSTISDMLRCRNIVQILHGCASLLKITQRGSPDVQKSYIQKLSNDKPMESTNDRNHGDVEPKQNTARRRRMVSKEISGNKDDPSLGIQQPCSVKHEIYLRKQEDKGCPGALDVEIFALLGKGVQRWFGGRGPLNIVPIKPDF